MLAEAVVYLLVAVAMALFWMLGQTVRSKNVRYRGELRSSDIAHAIRRRQRPKP